MASHTGQKRTRFFCSSRDFLFKLRPLFLMWGFQYSSRDLFYWSWNVSIQVEIFFVQVEMFLFKSRFFHVEIFISSRGFFVWCRDLYFKSSFLSDVENFFMSTFFFSRGECVFIASRDFCYLWGLSRGHFAIQGEMLPRSTCWH